MGTSRLSREEQIRSKTRKFCTKISKAHRTNTGALSGNHLFFFFLLLLIIKGLPWWLRW